MTDAMDLLRQLEKTFDKRDISRKFMYRFPLEEQR
jgi:hypothetical protein